MSTATLPAATAARADADRPRHVEAFCSAAGAEAFHSIVGPGEVWKADPYDIEAIHAEARETFQRLVHRAASPSGASAGRILLLLGESGSGKTHLMRVLAGEAVPDGGRVETGPRVQAGHFTQLNARPDLKSDRTILDTVLQPTNGDV